MLNSGGDPGLHEGIVAVGSGPEGKAGLRYVNGRAYRRRMWYWRFNRRISAVSPPQGGGKPIGGNSRTAIKRRNTMNCSLKKAVVTAETESVM